MVSLLITNEEILEGLQCRSRICSTTTSASLKAILDPRTQFSREYLVEKGFYNSNGSDTTYNSDKNVLLKMNQDPVVIPYNNKINESRLKDIANHYDVPVDSVVVNDSEVTHVCLKPLISQYSEISINGAHLAKIALQEVQDGDHAYVDDVGRDQVYDKISQLFENLGLTYDYNSRYVRKAVHGSGTFSSRVANACRKLKINPPVVDVAKGEARFLGVKFSRSGDHAVERLYQDCLVFLYDSCGRPDIDCCLFPVTDFIIYGNECPSGGPSFFRQYFLSFVEKYKGSTYGRFLKHDVSSVHVSSLMPRDILQYIVWTRCYIGGLCESPEKIDNFFSALDPKIKVPYDFHILGSVGKSAYEHYAKAIFSQRKISFRDFNLKMLRSGDIILASWKRSGFKMAWTDKNNSASGDEILPYVYSVIGYISIACGSKPCANFLSAIFGQPLLDISFSTGEYNDYTMQLATMTISMGSKYPVHYKRRKKSLVLQSGMESISTPLIEYNKWSSNPDFSKLEKMFAKELLKDKHRYGPQVLKEQIPKIQISFKQFN